MSEAYCRPITDITHRAYEIGLAGIAVERIESAVVEAIRTRKFMPVAAELRELCGEAKADSPEQRFIEDCKRAEIDCERRRRENPMIPITGPREQPKRLLCSSPTKTQQQLLEEIAAIARADAENPK